MDDEVKRWMPAIVLGGVLALALVVLGVQTFTGDDGPEDPTTTTTSTTPSTTTSSSTTSTTEATTTAAPTTPTTVATTTATTAAPTTTTAPPSTTTTTRRRDEPGDAQLLADCEAGNPFACYDVGSRGLTPPTAIGDTTPWRGATDQAVDDGCGQGLLPACYEAGRRGRPIGG